MDGVSRPEGTHGPLFRETKPGKDRESDGNDSRNDGNRKEQDKMNRFPLPEKAAAGTRFKGICGVSAFNANNGSGLRALWRFSNLNDTGNAGLACGNGNNTPGNANWNERPRLSSHQDTNGYPIHHRVRREKIGYCQHRGKTLTHEKSSCVRRVEERPRLRPTTAGEPRDRGHRQRTA